VKLPRRLVGLAFLMPFMVLYLLFYFVSTGYAVYLSFFRQLGLNPAVFVGWQNFSQALFDSQFLSSLEQIARFGLVQIPIMLGLALVFALYTDSHKNRLAAIFGTVMFVPYALPGVISGLMWGYLYSKSLSPFQIFFGQDFDFLSQEHVMFAVGNIFTWTYTGYNSIILGSSLKSIAPELYEAATVDGANAWQIIYFIKLPMLRPTLILTLLFAIIGVLQIFTEPFVIRSLAYVPVNLTPNLYIYANAFSYGNFNYAAALSVIIAVLTFTFSSLLLSLIRRFP
jgi:multiple sugar transport system permease protein